MDYLLKLLSYTEDKPLLFTQLYFWGFFLLVLVGYVYVYKWKAARNIWLLAASLFFYWKTSGFYVLILIFSTLVDFYIGKAIFRTENERNRKMLVGLSVLVNLLVLFYFKYTEFFTSNINDLLGTDFHIKNYFSLAVNETFGTSFRVEKIVLPVGISFFTFQTISYSVDVYRRRIEPVNSILDFGFYVSFFPQLVAGPIVRAAEFVPQLYKQYNLTRQQFGIAIFWILNGLLKKMFISDYISVNYVDRVFDNPQAFTGFENLIALYGYSLQVYCDFSGYTDIAIGVALLLGFHLPVNFLSPYKARSTAEFWQRWHISLSTWLKDYLYIPLGGNRKGTPGTWINMAFLMLVIVMLSGWLGLGIIFLAGVLIFIVLSNLFPAMRLAIVRNVNTMVTMLWGGLWHGSSWMFFIWGGLNGLGILTYRFWKERRGVTRWVVWALLNLAGLITWLAGAWANPNGFIVWGILNVLWIISYLVWYVKYFDNASARLSRIGINVLLMLCLSFVMALFSGLWFGEHGVAVWIFLTVFFVSGYYLLREMMQHKWIVAVLGINFFAALSFLLAAPQVGFWAVIWLLAGISWLLVWSVLKVRQGIKTTDKHWLVHFWGMFFTFNFITFTRIFFRGENLEIARGIFIQLINDWKLSLIPRIIVSYKEVFLVMVLGITVHYVSESFKERYRNWFVQSPMWVKAALSALVVFICYQARSSELQPFIYFQF